MIPATPDEVRAACLDRSATDASRYLARQGKRISATYCQVVIARLIAAGERDRMDRVGFVSDGEKFDINRAQAIKGCKALLKRQLETGMHSLTTVDQMVEAYASIGMTRRD